MTLFYSGLDPSAVSEASLDAVDDIKKSRQVVTKCTLNGATQVVNCFPKCIHMDGVTHVNGYFL